MKFLSKRELIPLWMCFLLLSFGIGFIPLLDHPDKISVQTLIVFNSVGWFSICLYFIVIICKGLKND